MKPRRHAAPLQMRDLRCQSEACVAKTSYSEIVEITQTPPSQSTRPRTRGVCVVLVEGGIHFERSCLQRPETHIGLRSADSWALGDRAFL